MKIAIIGAGNMGGATALGLARFIPEIEVTATAKHQETLNKYSSDNFCSQIPIETPDRRPIAATAVRATQVFVRRVSCSSPSCSADSGDIASTSPAAALSVQKQAPRQRPDFRKIRERGGWTR